VQDSSLSADSDSLAALSALLRKYIPDARRLAADRVINTQLPREIYRFGFVFVDGEKMGKHYKAIPMTPEIQEWLVNGDAVLSREWEALIMKVKLSLETMAMCLDHFRVEVMKKRGYKAIMPVLGCAACGATAAVGVGGRTADLLRCDRCRSAFYCGVRCQRVHWPEHKADCKKWTSGGAAASSSKAETAEGKPEGKGRRASNSSSSSVGPDYEQDHPGSTDPKHTSVQSAGAASAAASSIKAAAANSRKWGPATLPAINNTVRWLMVLFVLLAVVDVLLRYNKVYPV
jgi:hypothetical protein